MDEETLSRCFSPFGSITPSTLSSLFGDRYWPWLDKLADTYGIHHDPGSAEAIILAALQELAHTIGFHEPIPVPARLVWITPWGKGIPEFEAKTELIEDWILRLSEAHGTVPIVTTAVALDAYAVARDFRLPALRYKHFDRITPLVRLLVPEPAAAA